MANGILVRMEEDRKFIGPSIGGGSLNVERGVGGALMRTYVDWRMNIGKGDLVVQGGGSMKSKHPPYSRRRFLSSTAGVAAFSIVGGKKTMGAPVREGGVIVGEGEHKYEVINDWVRLPDKYSWQTTHNVAVDKDGNLYVIHEGKASLPDHPHHGGIAWTGIVAGVALAGSLFVNNRLCRKCEACDHDQGAA